MAPSAATGVVAVAVVVSVVVADEEEVAGVGRGGASLVSCVVGVVVVAGVGG